MTAIARGKVWWAHGQLEVLRRYCVSLARLRRDFGVSSGGDEPYFKVELDLPPEELAAFVPTVGPLELSSIFTAGRTLIDFNHSHELRRHPDHHLSAVSFQETLLTADG